MRAYTAPGADTCPEPAEGSITGFADTRLFGYAGARTEMPGVKSGMSHPLAGSHLLWKDNKFAQNLHSTVFGNALDAAQMLEYLQERGVLSDDRFGSSLQRIDARVQFFNRLSYVQQYLRRRFADASTGSAQVTCRA